MGSVNATLVQLTVDSEADNKRQRDLRARKKAAKQVS
jgi:hypothetical protein